MSDVKAIDFKVEGGFFVLTLDPNKNGTPILTLKLNLAEVPVEILDALKK